MRCDQGSFECSIPMAPGGCARHRQVERSQSPDPACKGRQAAPPSLCIGQAWHQQRSTTVHDKRGTKTSTSSLQRKECLQSAELGRLNGIQSVDHQQGACSPRLVYTSPSIMYAGTRGACTLPLLTSIACAALVSAACGMNCHTILSSRPLNCGERRGSSHARAKIA